MFTDNFQKPPYFKDSLLIDYEIDAIINAAKNGVDVSENLLILCLNFPCFLLNCSCINTIQNVTIFIKIS